MAFNVICGLPRSGSTLLCNILNQNPEFYATSTSPLSNIIDETAKQFSLHSEVKSELIMYPQETKDRVRDALIGLVAGWYRPYKDVTIFDKGRRWSHIANVLLHMLPDTKIIVTVRDLRDIFASIEKQHEKFPVFDASITPHDRTVGNRFENYFSPQGLVGMSVNGVEDLLRRSSTASSKVQRSLTIVQYEQLAARPEDTLRRLYADLGQDWFDHDFENVEDSSTDIDGLYLDKFPHKGSGGVQPPDPEERDRWVPKDVQQIIMQRYQVYNSTFGYTV